MYPEAEASEDEDRTSVTSQNQISNLVNKMVPGQPGLPASGQDYVSTQIASGASLDKQREMAALANELGDPMDMDGTVEIQNPMQVWQQAQNAMAAARNAAASAPAPAPAQPDYDDDEDEFDHSPTEVVDVSALSFAFNSAAPKPAPPPAVESRGETYAPTEPQTAVADHGQAPGQQFGRPPEPAHHYPATAPNSAVAPRDSSSEFDAAYGSGQYAPNTPPGGRQTNESWDQQPAPQYAQQPPPQPQQQQQYQPQYQQQPAPQYAQPQPPAQQSQQGFGNAGGFDRSPSGLTGAALFGDMPAEEPSMPMEQGSGPAVAGDHPGPWKLRTNFGLTYEFPDTRGLRSWLSSREELDGYTVSSDDGASFHALDAFAQLDRNAGRTPSMSGNMSTGSGLYKDPTGSGQYRDPTNERSPSQSGLNAYGSGLHTAPNSNPTGAVKGPVVNSEYRPPSRESKSKLLLWLVFLLLAGVAVLIGLETFGIVSLGAAARELGVLPEKENAVQPIEQNPNHNTAEVVDVDNAAIAKRQAAEVEQLLKDATRLVDGNKLPAALDTLKTTKQIAPDNPIVYDLEARVYDKLGKDDEATASRAKAAELRSAADEASEGEEPDGEEPEGGADDPPKAE